MKWSVDPHQLTLDWGGSGTSERATDEPAAAPTPTPGEPVPALAPSPPLALSLPWDFLATFPEPTDEALEAGVVRDEDIHPDGLRSLHDEHARQALAVLRDLEAVLDARRRGVDPSTGRAPRTASAKAKLSKLFATRPALLERTFAALMGAYEDAFGSEAAVAFERAIRAWHGGVDVVAAASGSRSRGVTQRTEGNDNTSFRRLSSRLPVPRPLLASVAAGHFGQEEDGRPVRPEPDEVRAITERHAERVMDLLGRLRSRSPGGEADRDRVEYDRFVAMYAEDFGERAARRLEAYARRQLDRS